MKTRILKLTATTLASAVLAAASLGAQAGGKVYAVTITNITKAQIFTPIMVASHGADTKLFTLGEAASSELEILAESGNPGPLSDKLADEADADVAVAGDVLLPGDSVTLYVKAGGKNKYISVASMLVPSNDAMFAVNGIRAPKGRDSLELGSPAYDAGTEDNDELCVSIPGPPFLCQGEGVSAGGGEGSVYVHSGIRGIGDVHADTYDWRNPVASISIRRTSRPE